MLIRWLILALVLVIAVPPVFAQKSEANKKPAVELEQTIETDEAQPAPKPGARDGKDSLSITRHEVTIGDQTIRYTATAGTLPLKKEEGKTRAEVFFVAYTRDDVEDAERRPLTFAFNGGPGSSSVWLHLGLLSPRRIKLADAPHTTKPPFELIDNEYSLLDATDLVFIDPVGTGYSRPASGEEKKQFHGYEEDIRSVGEFIHLYVTREGRWRSPRFLIGESYGGLRAAGLAGHLLDRYYMTLNGVVLVSAVLDFQTLSAEGSNDLPYVVFLPSYTATAWYHKRLPGDLQDRPLKGLLPEVERFALQEYAPALLRGATLPAKKRAAMAEKLARYTGLSTEYVERSNLRIDAGRFRKELLRETERTVGRFDSRYVGTDRDAAGSQAEYDPSGSAVYGPFTAAMYDYLHDDLRVSRERPYEILSSSVHPWSYQSFTNRYVESTDTLRKAMTRTPYLKVFAATGYYDLATPYLAMEYTMNHLALDPALRKNITLSHYEGGHMMYTHEPSLKRLKADLQRFYTTAAP